MKPGPSLSGREEDIVSVVIFFAAVVVVVLCVAFYFDVRRRSSRRLPEDLHASRHPRKSREGRVYRHGPPGGPSL